MMNFPAIAELRTAADTAVNPQLRKLLADRLADTVRCELQNLTHLLVIEADDSEQQIVDAVGFSPLQTRINGIRNQPDWDWIERHDGWWELLYTVGNDGFAYILLVEDDDRSPLALLCRREGA